jgi:hypothetical protein
MPRKQERCETACRNPESAGSDHTGQVERAGKTTRFIDAERLAAVASHLNVKHTLSRQLAANLRGGRGRFYV